MKVVLLENVKGQGKQGDVINVSEGYARNFLFPKKLATEATTAALNDLKGKQEAFAYKKETEHGEAVAMKEKLSGISVTLTAKAGANGKLFGSITNKDIAQALIDQHHIKIDKRRFETEDFKQVGEYTVSIKLYPEITGELKVIIKEA